MLRLKNIEIHNGIISAQYDPEESGFLGFISIDLHSGEIIKKQYSEFEEDFPIYFHHALTALKRIVEKHGTSDGFIGSELIMWY